MADAGLSLHQMPACALHKNILQSRLPKGALSVQRGQKRDGLFTAVEVVAFCPFRCFLIYGLFAQAVDQARWSIDLLQLSVIHKCYPVAERLCLFHIVGCQKNGQIFSVQLTEKIPHLSSG